MKPFRRVLGTIHLAASLRLVAMVAAMAIFATSAVLSAQDVTTQPTTALATSLPADQPDAPASPAPAPSAPAPAGSAAEDAGAIKMVQPGSFEIHVRDTDLRVVLQLLSSQGRRNIVATKEVSGKFSADLYGVTFKEALDAVMRSTGFVYEERGNFVYVYTDEQLKKIKKDERVMVTKSFRLYYMTATDAKKLLTPALSAEGAIEITPVSAVGISPSKEITGGNSYATDDMLVAHDYEDNVKNITGLIQEMDVKPEQVLIEATILKASLREDNELGINFNVLSGISFKTLGDSSVDVTNTSNGSGIRTDFPMPSGGMSFGFVSNNIAMFISALEKVTPTTVLANPKLLVINKQRGEVLVGRHQGYQTTLSTETTTSSSIAFLDSGTRLLVRPFIGKDGYIRMEIHPEDSIGSTETVGTTLIPSLDSTEVTTNVLVRDGHTIVIGGLFRDQVDVTRSQVPGLGNLPGVGALFRSTIDKTQRDEIIILITPRIIKQASDEALGEQLKDDAERYRIGARKSLQWFGRERLATAFMRTARKNVSAGETDKALWNVDLALSMSPQMLEAIQLKERLTNKAYWSDETRVSDAKNIIERMITQEMGLPVEPIVTPEKPLDTGTINPAVRDALGIEPKPLEEMPGLDGQAEAEKVEVIKAKEVQEAAPQTDQTENQPASAPASEPVE
jgi:type IV pilus assembly protein PilQ